MSKPASHPVQLFPFLAVLICAMGALILLLLVTTRRMRQVAVEKAIEERQAKVVEQLAARAQAPAPPVLPDLPARNLEPAPLYVPPAAIQLARPVPVVDEVAEAKLRAEWKGIVDELARDYSDQVKLLAAIRADTVLKQQEQEAEKTALEEEKDRIEKKKRKAYSLRQETAADVARLEQDKAQLDGELKKVKRATNIKAEELANQPTPYTLLPYDGALGTTRRPIILECNERSITFRCEGIELAASQLSGFPSEYNPLLAGTRALHEYWVVRDRENATLKTPPPPYVLLVVRPKGTVAYYVARKLLEKFEHPYGYELVEEGRELTWPASDDDAVRVCREAVERALTERDRVLARLAGPGGPGGGSGGGRYPITGELRYDGQRGEFITEEVEQLRNLDDSVVVGGQRWKREPRGNGAMGGGGAGGGSLDPGPSSVPNAFQTSRGGGRGGAGTSTGPGGSGNRSDGSANGAPSGTGTNRGEPGGASFGEAAESRLAAADPESSGGSGNGGANGTGSAPSGPDGPAAAARSSGDSRSLAGSRTFQGSGGPRLGSGGGRGSGNPFGGSGEPGGRPGSSGGGGSGGGGGTSSGNGDLHPYHDPPSRPSEPDAPQGTGPITARNLPRLAPGPGRGNGPAQGGAGTSPPSGNIRGSGQGSGGAENTGGAEGSGLAGNGGTGGGTSGGDAATDKTLASNGPAGARSGSPGSGTRSGTPGPAGAGQTGSGTAGSGAPGYGAADAGASSFGSTGGGQAGAGTASGGTAGPSGGGATGGSSGGGGPSSGVPGEATEGSAPEGMPVPRNLRAIGQQDPSAKPGKGKPAPRRWGEPDHSGTIALERSVVIDVKEEGVTVEDEPELTLKEGTAYRELKDRLAFTLENHASKWGRPPASFYWLPTVTFRIHPGGNQYYQAMKALTDDWGLHSKVEHVLE